MFIYALPLRDRVERAAWVRLLIVVTILVLLALVLVTPRFLGQPSELESFPVLVVGLNKEQTLWIVSVGGSVQPYMYEGILLEARDPTNTTLANETVGDAYDASLRLPVNASATLDLHTWLLDRQGNYFEYNVTVWLFTLEGRTMMGIAFPDEDSAPNQTRTPPADFRIPVPRRGNL